MPSSIMGSRVALPTEGWTYIHQSLIKAIFDRLSYRSVLLRNFSLKIPFYQIYLALVKIDNKQPEKLTPGQFDKPFTVQL